MNSNKGPALARWALYRRTNLLLLLGGVIMATILTSVGMSFVGTPDPATGTDASNSEVTVPLPAWARVAEEDPEALDLDRAGQAQALTRAEGFARAWTADGPGWVAGFRPHAAEGILPLLEFYDRSTIPEGKPQSVRIIDATEYGATARVTYPGQSLLDLTLSFDGRRWTVVDFREPQ